MPKSSANLGKPANRDGKILRIFLFISSVASVSAGKLDLLASQNPGNRRGMTSDVRAAHHFGVGAGSASGANVVEKIARMRRNVKASFPRQFALKSSTNRTPSA